MILCSKLQLLFMVSVCILICRVRGAFGSNCLLNLQILLKLLLRYILFIQIHKIFLICVFSQKVSTSSQS